MVDLTLARRAFFPTLQDSYSCLPKESVALKKKGEMQKKGVRDGK